MPPPPNYDCPVCKKGFQRGYLAKHICTHEQKELIKYVINKDSSTETNWHPAFNCSGHTYFICVTNKEGFEKDTLLHKKHISCKHSYTDWLNHKTVTIAPIQKNKEKNIIGEELDEPVNAINMILPDDEITNNTHNTCNCHFEITRLKNELLLLQNWRDLIISSVPKTQQKVDLLSKPQEKLQEKPQEKPQETNQILPIKHIQPVVKKTTKLKASKKEIEKGMWCVDCSACKTTAQFATDLRECCNCKKLSHFNDDLTNCYHWDCTVCDKKSCYSCVKAAGGNKVKPLCSQACAAIYKSQRE